MPTVATINASLCEADLDEYELDVLNRFVAFITKKNEKGKFIVNRVESGGVIEIEMVHYHGRRRFTERNR